MYFAESFQLTIQKSTNLILFEFLFAPDLDYDWFVDLSGLEINIQKNLYFLIFTRLTRILS